MQLASLLLVKCCYFIYTGEATVIKYFNWRARVEWRVDKSSKSKYHSFLQGPSQDFLNAGEGRGTNYLANSTLVDSLGKTVYK